MADGVASTYGHYGSSATRSACYSSRSVGSMCSNSRDWDGRVLLFAGLVEGVVREEIKDIGI